LLTGRYQVRLVLSLDNEAIGVATRRFTRSYRKGVVPRSPEASQCPGNQEGADPKIDAFPKAKELLTPRNRSAGAPTPTRAVLVVLSRCDTIKAGQSMYEGRPCPARVPTLLERLLNAVEHRVFRDLDINATAKGWRVGRPGPFRRSYRDPRWNLVSVCAECRGAGTVGARECRACDGDGRIIADPAENVGVR
jgi:hypothetical protein